MKSIILIRHAKSSPDISKPDINRSLNERGHHDAPMMAKRLVDKKIKIDAFISSPALRALTTAEYFFKAYHQNTKSNGIIKIPALYHASPSVYFDVMNHLNEKFTTIALFAHNPGITDFVNQLTSARIDNMPTCGIFAVKIKAEKWSECQEAEKEFWFFDYHKLTD